MKLIAFLLLLLVGCSDSCEIDSCGIACKRGIENGHMQSYNKVGGCICAVTSQDGGFVNK